MSRHPFPARTGRPQSLRADLFKKPCGTDRKKLLAAGKSVSFPTEWLVSHFPTGREHPSLPPDLGVHDLWLLIGDDTLVGTRDES